MTNHGLDDFSMGDPPEPGADAPAYLAGLNPAQRAAVEALDGPVLVLAGAGTGKTRVLTARLAHLLSQGRAQPWQVLSVTFTNRAAREMRERVIQLVGAPAEAIWLGTFHAIGARILRRHAERVGLRSNFTILDADDQIRLVKQLLEARNLDAKRWPARAMAGVIQRWKDRGLTPDKIGPAEAGDLAGGRLHTLYAEYQERLLTLNAVDFGDLLLHCLSLFQADAEVLEEYQRRFRFILVDEYQDTNVAQYLFLRLLAQRHRNIACVGDDDQSIYAWRGAEVGNILRFEKDFPGARIIRLEQNYRSSAHILGAASGLIAANRGRLGKTLWTEAEGGPPVIIRGVWDGQEEARWVADEIEALQRRQGVKHGEVAVLVRASAQMRAFEERFLAIGMPYRVVGGPRFYERLEIRDALAYLRIIHQEDDDLAFERIVNKPRRGLGEATLRLLHRAARAQGASLLRTARLLITTDEIKPAARNRLAQFLGQLDHWRALDQGATLGRDGARASHPQLAEIVLDESGYTGMLQADRSPDAAGRLENLKELIAAMTEFENLAGFLEHVSLVMEAAEGSARDSVNLMTLHAAKGLEFDAVFLPGWEEDLFPHRRSLEENGAAGLEEERRLAHVGLTRARRHAYVSFASSRNTYGQWLHAAPSRFVEELPAANVEVVNDWGRQSASGRRPAHAPNMSAFARPPGGARARRPLVLEGRARVIAPDAPQEQGPARGARVFHEKFGYGTVIGVDGGKLEIAFEKAGTKKVMASFVVPAETV